MACKHLRDVAAKPVRRPNVEGATARATREAEASATWCPPAAKRATATSPGTARAQTTPGPRREKQRKQKAQKDTERQEKQKQSKPTEGEVQLLTIRTFCLARSISFCCLFCVLVLLLLLLLSGLLFLRPMLLLLSALSILPARRGVKTNGKARAWVRGLEVAVYHQEPLLRADLENCSLDTGTTIGPPSTFVRDGGGSTASVGQAKTPRQKPNVRGNGRNAGRDADRSQRALSTLEFMHSLSHHSRWRQGTNGKPPILQNVNKASRCGAHTHTHAHDLFASPRPLPRGTFGIGAAPVVCPKVDCFCG